MSKNYKKIKWPALTEPKRSLEAELKAVYDSEINIEISWFWDGDVDLRVGDTMNGFADLSRWNAGGDGYATVTVESVSDIAPALREILPVIYPDSAYARALKEG